jgi:hypothetical protein
MLDRSRNDSEMAPAMGDDNRIRESCGGLQDSGHSQGRFGREATHSPNPEDVLNAAGVDTQIQA